MKTHRRTLLQRVLVRSEDIVSAFVSVVTLAIDRFARLVEKAGEAPTDLVDRFLRTKR